MNKNMTGKIQPKIKIDSRNVDKFRRAIEIVIAQGVGMWLPNGQEELHINFGDVDIVLNLNGKWEIQ